MERKSWDEHGRVFMITAVVVMAIYRIQGRLSNETWVFTAEVRKASA